jgi:hypothetical protein
MYGTISLQSSRKGTFKMNSRSPSRARNAGKIPPKNGHLKGVLIPLGEHKSVCCGERQEDVKPSVGFGEPHIVPADEKDDDQQDVVGKAKRLLTDSRILPVRRSSSRPRSGRNLRPTNVEFCTSTYLPARLNTACLSTLPYPRPSCPAPAANHSGASLQDISFLLTLSFVKALGRTV